MPSINPEILTWARESAGFDLAEAARKIGLNNARGVPGADRLAAMEAGDQDPSEALLSRIAKQYHRPLLTFYMPAPPRADDVGEDFRTLPEQGDPGNSVLMTLLRDIKARQQLARELIEDDEDAKEVAFIGSCRREEGAQRLAMAIASGIEFDRQAYREARTTDDAFTYLRRQVEKAGIFVVLAGSLGSWQTAIEVKVFRGFALADRLAPFVVINDQDARSAWSFTLLHELTHLWLGETGVSGGSTAAGLERLCNDVAASILVDADEFEDLTDDEVIDHHAITAFAEEMKISRAMVAYQLFRLNRIQETTWRTFSERFKQEWLTARNAQRESARNADGGPNWYVVRRHRIGAALIDLVKRGVDGGTVTPVRAAKILGVKPMTVYNLIAGGDRQIRAA